MNTEMLLTILIALVLLLIIAVVWLIARTYLTNNQLPLLSMKAQLEDQYQNDKTLLLKSQETATTLLSLQQQFQTLSQEFHVLNKGSYHSQNMINDISSNLNEIQKVMVNKKARGNWGEYQLEMLLSLYVGKSKDIYESQYTLSSGVIGDVALHLPDTDKVLILDAKFPMENYQNILQNSQRKALEERYIQLFKTNIKKHIHDISQKYITSETLDTAIMFIPSEAIYTFICSECPELIDESYRHHVLMTSPTTLAGVVFTLLNITKEFHRTEHIKEIEKEISALLDDTSRLVERAAKASQYAGLTVKHMEEMQISIRKLANRIEKISEGSSE